MYCLVVYFCFFSNGNNLLVIVLIKFCFLGFLLRMLNNLFKDFIIMYIVVLYSIVDVLILLIIKYDLNFLFLSVILMFLFRFFLEI